MLWVRRHAPDGSYFNDGDRAAGVFGVLATGFAVLLGFVVFLAFTSYDAARAGAESEARIVAQQVETAQLLPPAVSSELTAELVCYARSVAGVQWDRMEAGTLGDELNPWAVKLFQTLKRADPQTPTRAGGVQQVARRAIRPRRGAQRPHPRRRRRDPDAAVDRAVLHRRADLRLHAVLRRQRRTRRRAGAADGHGGRGRSCRCCSCLQFLDHPFHEGIGGLRPVAMERTLKIIDQELGVAGEVNNPPCDSKGNSHMTTGAAAARPGRSPVRAGSAGRGSEPPSTLAFAVANSASSMTPFALRSARRASSSAGLAVLPAASFTYCLKLFLLLLMASSERFCIELPAGDQVHEHAEIRHDDDEDHPERLAPSAEGVIVEDVRGNVEQQHDPQEEHGRTRTSTTGPGRPLIPRASTPPHSEKRSSGGGPAAQGKPPRRPLHRKRCRNSGETSSKHLDGENAGCRST